MQSILQGIKQLECGLWVWTYAMPFVTSSFFFLVVRPGTTFVASFHAPNETLLIGLRNRCGTGHGFRQDNACQTHFNTVVR